MFFKVNHQSSKSRARTGTITTDHGTVQTPTFAPCGTKGTIKGLTQEQIKNLKIQFVCVNTYHLVMDPGVEVLEKAGGIHPLAKFPISLMSDSGDFRYFHWQTKINGVLQYAEMSNHWWKKYRRME